jgi:nitrite reductase/ring-hydroxylating ferredoxin subunit/uncharacterized membrane protein
MSDFPQLLERFARTIEHADRLDDIARAVEPYVERMTASPTVKAVLSGAPIGHRLHPMLTDIPIGCWTSATVLDVVAWRSGATAARRLLALGIVSAVPTVAAGASDWSDSYGESKRIGVVHAASNTVALGFEIASWIARRRGRHVRGALLGLCGIGAATVGGYLGGRMVYTERVGVDAEVPVVADDGWHIACAESDLLDGRPFGVTVDGVRVVLVRRYDDVYALAAVCTHAGGPLDRGEVHDGVIQCPWHGSEFCLRDGAVFRGPAASAEPVYATRIRAGLVEIRRGLAEVIDLSPALV